MEISVSTSQSCWNHSLMSQPRASVIAPSATTISAIFTSRRTRAQPLDEPVGATAAPDSGGPKTWVAVLDLALGALVVLYALRLAQRPRDPAREEQMIARMRKVASSNAAAIFAAGATLANAGAFIPIALKDIS